MTSPVQPERILKDLRNLWVDLGKQESTGVLRACSMTFIAVIEESEDTSAISETIAALMHEHPSRAIVLRVREDAKPHLDARVFAQCWMPFGRRQQICCEQIEITSSTASLNDVDQVLLGIMAPDLPVVLFCPSGKLWNSEGVQRLLSLAHKFIVDSDKFPRGAGLLDDLTSLSKRKCFKSDLAWARLTPWREAVSQIFDNPATRRRVYDLESIEILYSGDEPLAVYYLAGWFMYVLGSDVNIQTVRGAGPSYSSVARIGFKAGNFTAAVELMDENSVEQRIDGVHQRIVFPVLNDYDVLRQELGIMTRDAIFEEVVVLAHSIRGGL